MEAPAARISRRNPEQLLAAAHDAQYAARHREAVPEDTFLVTPSDDPSPSAYPNRVRAITVRDAVVVSTCLRSAATCSGKGRRSQVAIRKTLSVQRSDSVTYALSPFSTADSLPGEVPVIDHLCLRAREEPSWMAVAPVLEEIRQRRSPHNIDVEVVEIHLGITSGDTIAAHTRELAAAIADATQRYGFCRLAADVEKVRLPAAPFRQFSSEFKPVSFHPLPPWETAEDVILAPVRLMMGTDRFAIYIRVDLQRKVTGEGETLTVSPFKIPLELQDLFNTAGSMVGVGIRDDLDEFTAFLSAISRQEFSFVQPIDVAVVARLAGYNLPRHGVQALVWTFLGCTLPKNEASVGDGRWHLPLASLEIEYGHYLCGDVVQVFLTFYTIVTSWVQHVFPEFHAVSKSSLATSVNDLLGWWVAHVIDAIPDTADEPPAWTPVSSRAEATSRMVKDATWEPRLQHLTPDWPAVTTGGCRYFHTVRSWLFSRLPALREIDSVFWPDLYIEDEVFVRLGRIVPSEPSPRQPACRFRMMEDPQFSDLLPVPATAITPQIFSQLVKGGRPKRAILIEYALAHPLHAAEFLVHVESSKPTAEKYFNNKKKAGKLVAELRSTLTVLSALPRRPEGWVDLFPPSDPTLRVERDRQIAEAVAATALRRGTHLLSRHQLIEEVLQEPVAQPAQAAVVATRVAQAINIRGPGNPDNNTRVLKSMGSRNPIRRPRPGPAPAVKPQPSTSRRSLHAPSARSGPHAGGYYFTVPSDSDSACSILYTCAAGETAQGTPPGSTLGPPPSPSGLVRSVENRSPLPCTSRGECLERRPSPTGTVESDRSSDKYQFTIPSAGSMNSDSGSVITYSPSVKPRGRGFDSTPRSRSNSSSFCPYVPQGPCPFYAEYIMGDKAENRYHQPVRTIRRSSSEWSDTPALKRQRSRSWSRGMRSSPVRRRQSPSPQRRHAVQHHSSPVRRLSAFHVSAPRCRSPSAHRTPSPRDRLGRDHRRSPPRRRRSPASWRHSPFGRRRSSSRRRHLSPARSRLSPHRRTPTPSVRSVQRSPSIPARQVQFRSPQREVTPAPPPPAPAQPLPAPVYRLANLLRRPPPGLPSPVSPREKTPQPQDTTPPSPLPGTSREKSASAEPSCSTRRSPSASAERQSPSSPAAPAKAPRSKRRSPASVKPSRSKRRSPSSSSSTSSSSSSSSSSEEIPSKDAVLLARALLKEYGFPGKKVRITKADIARMMNEAAAKKKSKKKKKKKSAKSPARKRDRD